MWRAYRLFALAAWLTLLGTCLAGEPTLSILTAPGTVERVGRDSLSLRARGPEGRFSKSLTLKLTGTSKLSTVTAERRGRQKVPVQRDAERQDLRPNQPIAVIYVQGPTGPVLLAAVVQPAER